MKRKNLKLLIATTVVTSMMLAGCGETELSADTQASSEVSIEAVTEASAEKTSDADTATEPGSTEEADTLNSTESTSSAGTTVTADEASTSVSVPEFSSADEEEQWVLDQISGLWFTVYQPGDLLMFERDTVNTYSGDINEDGLIDEYKKNSDGKITSIKKGTDEQGTYYQIIIWGKDYYWYTNQTDTLNCGTGEDYSGHSSFMRPMGGEKFEDFKIVD